VRGQDVYLIQQTASPVNRNLMELLITLQTLRLDSAARITAVVPYLAYGRSDKKDQPRVPITGRLVADMIEVAGADRYMTLDPHAGQIQGFFSIPGDVLTASRLIIENINQTLRSKLKNPVVVATDLGFAKKARNYATDMDMPVAFVEKRRTGNDAKAEALSLIGHVKDCDVLIVDDEVNTGGSISEAIKVVKENGALDVYLAFVHPIFSSDAAERLATLPIKHIITTDSVPISEENLKILRGRITVLSVAELLGEVIKRAHEGRSVGEMFNE
jgi:ribose-phosphate pyrophosphokinase